MNTKKQTYQSPQITEVRLDSEISLVLNSLPPFGPEEGIGQNTPDFFNPNSTINS